MNQNIKGDNVCPWGEAAVDLSNTQLTGAQQQWLGLQLASKNTRLRHLAKKYNLKKKTLQYYREKVQRGEPFRGKRGRPSILDSEGVVDLQRIMIGEATKDKKAFVAHLGAVRQQTMIRRHEDISEYQNPPKVAHCTVYRYISKACNCGTP